MATSFNMLIKMSFKTVRQNWRVCVGLMYGYNGEVWMNGEHWLERWRERVLVLNLASRDFLHPS